MLLEMNNEKQLMMKRCVRNRSASENCLRRRRVFLNIVGTSGLERLKEKNFCSIRVLLEKAAVKNGYFSRAKNEYADDADGYRQRRRG